MKDKIIRIENSLMKRRMLLNILVALFSERKESCVIMIIKILYDVQFIWKYMKSSFELNHKLSFLKAKSWFALLTDLLMWYNE